MKNTVHTTFSLILRPAQLRPDEMATTGNFSLIQDGLPYQMAKDYLLLDHREHPEAVPSLFMKSEFRGKIYAVDATGTLKFYGTTSY